MFPRQGGKGEEPEWALLGTFDSREVPFVRELLHDEGIEYREQAVPSRDGTMHCELWVASIQHARAAALVGEAQSEAEAAVYRETAALAAEQERAAKEEALAAATEARATAVAARKAARRAAQEEARELRQRRRWESRQARRLVQQSADDRGVRILRGILAALVILFLLIFIIGERYGTHAPTPGHDYKPISCHGRICY
jgi:hypothetical protein